MSKSSKKTFKSDIEEFVAKTEERPDASMLMQENARLKKKLLRGQGTEDIIVEAVKQVMSDKQVIPTPPEPKLPSKGYEEIAVLHISDTQIGKQTESYDHVVAAQRLMLLAKKTVEVTNMRRSVSRIDEIHVMLGGDIVEGNEIFATQANHISLELIDQATKEGPEMLAGVLRYLLQHFKFVKVLCVSGNHGRATRADPAASEKTNWDRVAYRVLEHMLRDAIDAGRCEFEISDTFWASDNVCGWTNLLVHGHQIRGGFAGFPWYGAAKKVSGWIDSIGEPYDYVYVGHFHTYSSTTINHRILLANGTTESGNTYAQEQLAACGHPCQRLAFYNKAHGLVSDNQIFLDKRVPNRKKSEGWK